jgi:hypothetical protein
VDFPIKSSTKTLVGRLLVDKLQDFNDQIVKFSRTTTCQHSSTGYEGVSIESIEIRDVNTEYLQKYTWAITTPSEGVI